MTGKRIVAAHLLFLMMGWSGFTTAAAAQPMAAPPPAAPTMAPEESDAATPPRVSYLNGQVSFWRQGASDWAPAQLNTPLAPGDVLYAGQDGAAEIQIGRAAFVRAGNDTQIGFDNQEPNFLQFRVTTGHAGLDLRQVPAGAAIEIDTPQAAFTLDKPGYYRLDVEQDATALSTHRGGTATMTPPSGAPALIPPNQQVVLTGIESPQIALGAAPPLNPWDQWNNQRSAYLLRTASARYVSTAMYGTEELDQHGTWRTAETYGSVWVPSGVPAGWQPYSTGRWIWDPRFGWTWLDAAPWGWAPYHHGRWVFLGSYWGWAPGPVVVRPVYAPALVVFLGGATVGVAARPVYWAPLGWGEPVVPWWGRRGFVGVPWWGGWGGPRVVNNVVINRNTTINVTNITTYRNVNVTHAVVGVSAEKFGHGQTQVTRINQAEVAQLRPVHGALDVKPVAASVMPGGGAAVKPPTGTQTRAVVATRAPKDQTETLREHGLTGSREMTPAGGRLVAPPARTAPGATSTPGPSSASSGGPAPRSSERSKSTPPRAGALPAPGEAQSPEATRGHRAGRQGQPLPPGSGATAGVPGQPVPAGPGHRPGPPPRAEHPKHAERSSHPPRGEQQEKTK